MDKESTQHYDLLVIGGGVNGTGIASDASGRGLKVLLCEQNDLASATSSNSSKLIHGGLRYLEHYEFKLVKEALREREVLLANAPHIMSPLRFVLPYRTRLRSYWTLHAGLFLYDHLAKRSTLAPSKRIRFDVDSPLQSDIKKGFEYSDGWVDDARLVIFNALAAKQNGASILTQTKCQRVHRNGKTWEAQLCSSLTEKKEVTKVTAKAVVNAAGPWVTSIFDEILKIEAPQKVRLVKGSHIIVPKFHDWPQAFILQNHDGRIVFVLPYEDEFSLIGTTDVEFKGDPACVRIEQQEIDYLLSITNTYFKNKITEKDILHTFSGVRPLLDDDSQAPQVITRDYKLELQTDNGVLPLLSVFGGKITTYRTLAETAVNELSQFFPTIKPPWTKHKKLPGGEFESLPLLQQTLNLEYDFLTESMLKRFVRNYGIFATKFLQSRTSLTDLGLHFGHGLYEVEVLYLIDEEWASCADDILWRRTKLGLRFSEQQKTRLDNFISEHIACSDKDVSKPASNESI